MDVSLSPIWLLTFLLVFARALAWLLVVPPFNNRQVIPSPVLLGLAACLAILAAPQVPASAVPTDTPGLIGAVVINVFSGLMLGLPANILITAIGSGGGLLDMFGGLNLPPSIDPLSVNQMPILGQFYEQVGLMLLFITNGELMLVKGFTASLGKHAVMLTANGFASNVILADVQTYFVATMEIAAPLVAVLFATQIALAMLSRAAPQMNVWVMGFPIQIVLSLMFVIVGVRMLPGFVGNILDRISQDMTYLVNGHA